MKQPISGATEASTDVPLTGEAVVAVPPGSPGTPLSIRFLCLGLLLYVPIQWIAGARPGSTTIFTRQHRQIVTQFSSATAELQRELVASCRQHGIHDIFVGDVDTLSPYLVNEVEAIPNCVLHRETDVTPFEPQSELKCSALIVDESLPNAWVPERNQANLGVLANKVSTIGAWDSSGKLYDFELFQARECNQRLATP